MEFDYYADHSIAAAAVVAYADHSIAAAAVVAYADVGGVVARYEIKAFYRISDLSAKELDQRFKSAFFCLAEYFIQTNAGEEYHPSAKELSVEDIMLLLDMMNGPVEDACL